VDPEGRKALLVFAASLAFEKSEKLQGYVELATLAVTFVIAVAVLGKSCAVDLTDSESFHRGARWLLERIEAEVAKELGGFGLGAGPGGLDQALKDLRNPMGPAQVADRFLAAKGTVTGCRMDGPPWAFRAWLLKHESWKYAERSKTFSAWKERIDKVFVPHLACDGQDALLVLTSYGAGLMLADWRFFPSSEWPALQKRLDGLSDQLTSQPVAPPKDPLQSVLREALESAHARPTQDAGELLP
jgi:hypothetical protein